MTKLVVSLFVILTAFSSYAQSALDTLKVKLVYTGEGFNEYREKIQICVPCYLFVYDAKDSLLYRGIGKSLENNSHHFYTLKLDEGIHYEFLKLNSRIIATWPNDSIANFIRLNPQMSNKY